jgi:plasmid stabilization system protein ParE
MAESCRVILTQEVLAGIKEIASYIRQESPAAAASIAGAFLDGIDSLELMPGRFKRVGISRKRRTPVHALVVRPFTIYYRIDDRPKAVYILSVLHGAQRQPRQFE